MAKQRYQNHLFQLIVLDVMFQVVAARYPSTAIMSVIPAKIAGVERIVVVSPPNSSGNIDPLTLVTADIVWR